VFFAETFVEIQIKKRKCKKSVFFAETFVEVQIKKKKKFEKMCSFV
jgi:hypothetical protein